MSHENRNDKDKKARKVRIESNFPEGMTLILEVGYFSKGEDKLILSNDDIRKIHIATANYLIQVSHLKEKQGLIF